MIEVTSTLNARSLTKLLVKVIESFVALSFLILPALAAADWNYYPALRVAADFDDNPSLTHRTDEVEPISGFIGEANIVIAYNSDTGSFLIKPVVRTRKYDSEINRDSNDAFLFMRLRHDGVYNTLSLRMNYSRESVRTAEVADVNLDPDIDPDEIEDDETIAVDRRQRREKFRFVPRWTFRFSDVSAINTDVNFVTVKYEEETQQILRLADYTDVRARVWYDKEMSARTSLVILATARNYQTDFIDGDYSGYGLSAGFNSNLTENSELRFLVGAEKTEQINITDESPEFVGDISLVRRQQTTHFLAQLRRSISASGRGRLVARNELNLRFVRMLNQKFVAGLGARAFETQSLGTGDSETSYVQLNAQLIWRLSRAFSMQASYRHTVIERDSVGESGNSNRFTLWFNYQPNSVPELRNLRW